jgi:hypothetical protein
MEIVTERYRNIDFHTSYLRDKTAVVTLYPVDQIEV